MDKCCKYIKSWKQESIIAVQEDASAAEAKKFHFDGISKIQIKKFMEEYEIKGQKKSGKHRKDSSNYKITLKVNIIQVKRETHIFQQRKKYIFNRKGKKKSP